MLSKGNRDLCTHVEAVFWSDARECVENCKRLLIDETWRNQVASQGHLRSIRNAKTNEAIVKQIISRTFDRVCEEAAVSK
jgi:hypothetical protein